MGLVSLVWVIRRAFETAIVRVFLCFNGFFFRTVRLDFITGVRRRIGYRDNSACETCGTGILWWNTDYFPNEFKKPERKCWSRKVERGSRTPRERIFSILTHRDCCCFSKEYGGGGRGNNFCPTYGSCLPTSFIICILCLHEIKALAALLPLCLSTPRENHVICLFTHTRVGSLRRGYRVYTRISGILLARVCVCISFLPIPARRATNTIDLHIDIERAPGRACSTARV